MKYIVAKKDLICQSRMKRGLSVRKLAKDCQVDFLTIHRIETAKTKTVRPYTAKLICSALGVDFSELFELVDENPKGDAKDATYV